MRLVFAGTPAPALAALDALAASAHEIVAVVTRPDAVAGRGRSLQRSPVGAWADERGIEVLTPARPRDEEFQARLRALAPDCVPVVAYGALVPVSALEIPKYGWINVHFSLLPAWRGAAPVQHAVLHGDEVTGASVFQIEAGLDTGPVFGTVVDDIRPTDTSGDLLGRLAVEGAELLVRVLDGIEAGALTAVPQPGDGVSLAPKILVADAEVRWHEPAFAVDRRIRACTPEPGAWTSLGPERVELERVKLERVKLERVKLERVKLGPVRPVADGPALAPGEILVEKARVLVGTATTPVELGDVRAAGKKPMRAPDWARGARPEPGSRFRMEDGPEAETGDDA
jgi:methionyl-tRNA formyltransferase